jgi:hypothetical protein
VEGKSQPDRLTAVDVSNLPTHTGLNFEGTPTQFYDAEGNLKGLLTDTYRWGGKGQQIVDPNNFNLALGKGEKPSINSYVQTVNDQNQLMYIDPTTGKNTTDNTGIPATSYQLKDLLYMNDPGSRSRIAQDLKGLAYVATAALGGAAMGGAFAGAGAGAGAGLGVGEVATAYPVSSGALIQGTNLAPIAASGVGGAGALGAGGAGAVGAGSLTAGLTPEMIAASEAALPQTMADIGGLSSTAVGGAGSIGLTDAEATALMGSYEPGALGGYGATGASGLTAAEVLKYANLAKAGLGLVSGIAGAGGGGGSPAAGGGNYGSYGTGGGGALPGNMASTSLAGSSTAMLDPFKDYNKYQQIQAIQNEQAMQHVPVSEPLYAASGGAIHMEHGGITPRLENYYQTSGDERNVAAGLPADFYRKGLTDVASHGYSAGVGIPMGDAKLTADLMGYQYVSPQVTKDMLAAARLGIEFPVGEGRLRGEVTRPFQQGAPMHYGLTYRQHFASGGDVTSLAQIQERLSQLDPRLNSVLQNKLKANYYTYGSDNAGGLPTQLMGGQLGAKPSPGYPSQSASNARTALYDTYGFKPASLNQQERAPETVYAKDGGHIPEFITGATGHYVKGRGDGQSDEIPAMLADGEYVFDAETVAQLGNGSSDAGAKILDRMRENIREHKRSAPVDKIPPKSKSPLEYMAESKRK